MNFCSDEEISTSKKVKKAKAKALVQEELDEEEDDDSELDENELLSDDDEVNWAFIFILDMFRLGAISNFPIRIKLTDVFNSNGDNRLTKKKARKRRMMKTTTRMTSLRHPAKLPKLTRVRKPKTAFQMERPHRKSSRSRRSKKKRRTNRLPMRINRNQPTINRRLTQISHSRKRNPRHDKSQVV